jgi:hypothetical protein
VKHNTLQYITRKKQFKTGIQDLAFSQDGKVLFSSAGRKEVAITPLRIEDEDILSVEFGGFSDASKAENDSARDDDDGGDLRVMGIDVRDRCFHGVNGYLVALILSDSTVKVDLLRVLLTLVVLA